jgi:hypothetical protein
LMEVEVSCLKNYWIYVCQKIFFINRTKVY